MKLVRFAAVAISGFSSFACFAGDIDKISESQREQFIRKAQVWSPVPVEKMNLLVGPEDELAAQLTATVTCDFVPYPKDNSVGGATPKFSCRLPSGQVVKVKYGQKNGEVYGEVLGTRLFWALGFPADKVYPVSVNCRNCLKDPWAVYKAAPSDSAVDRKLYPEVRFPVAIIERKFDGETLETKDDQGFKWEELQKISSSAGGASRAQIDALTLLAAFIQHSDSKSANQRLSCPDSALQVSSSGQVECSRPVMMIQDLGATFAGGTGGGFLGIKQVQKVEFKGWQKRQIWSEKNSSAQEGVCITKLSKGHQGTIESDPVISEAGRAFLAQLLNRLSKQQITDLFTVSRVALKEKDVSVADWVELFQDKVSQITRMNCMTHQMSN